MSKKKVISECWFDGQDRQTTNGDIYCMVEYTYDKNGNINRERYFDQNGEPIRCLRGCAIVYREFNAARQVTYKRHLIR